MCTSLNCWLWGNVFISGSLLLVKNSIVWLFSTMTLRKWRNPPVFAKKKQFHELIEQHYWILETITQVNQHVMRLWGLKLLKASEDSSFSLYPLFNSLWWIWKALQRQCREARRLPDRADILLSREDSGHAAIPLRPRPPNHLIKQIIIIKVIKLCTPPCLLPLHRENRFKRSMETMRIRSEATTLADVTVKRGLIFLWSGSKTQIVGVEDLFGNIQFQISKPRAR